MSVNNVISPATWIEANAPPGPASPQPAAAREQAARDFESLLLHKLLQELGRTIPDAGLADSPAVSQARETFWYFLAQDLARQGGLGLWRQLCEEPAGPLARAQGPTPALEVRR